MAFQVSPGVQVREIDLTNVVPAVSTSVGATVIQSVWGPVEEIVTVTSEKDLVDKFGPPVDATAPYFFNAAAFLKYGNNLKVVRAVASGITGAKNATSTDTGVLVKNKDDFEASVPTHTIVAKYPGAVGNALKVTICPASDAAWAAWHPSIDEAEAWTGLFTDKPGTSAYAENLGSANDELHVLVIDNSGVITGTKGTILEKFAFVSQAKDAKNFDGSSNYFADVINNTSKYIWIGTSNPSVIVSGTAHTLSNSGDLASKTTSYETSTVPLTWTLSGGTEGSVNGGALDVGDIDTGFQLFNDAETVDVNLLIGAPIVVGTSAEDATAIANNVIAIADNRRDVVAFVSPPIDATVGTTTPKEDVLDFFNTVTASSYGFSDSTALKVYDKYNDVYRWIPACGHMAGLCAKTDNVADAWFSPGGFTRGQLLGVTRIAFNPKQAERDDLYKKRVNPIVSFPGEGTILFGDKTLQAKPSAFDRINVRRLFIVLEKAIATAAKYQLFELNDEFTRAMFRNMTEPFLREIKGRRGITDFKVVCDATNNTGEVIDSNQFVADIYIKPARSINFITLNFIATRTGVNFSEIGG